MAEFISCPQCQFQFAATDRIREEVQASLRARWESEAQDRVSTVRAQVQAEYDTRLANATRESNEREAELLRRAREVETRARAVTLEVEQKLAESQAALRTDVTREVQAGLQQQMAVLHAEVDKARRLAAASSEREAKLEARARELAKQQEEAALAAELEISRRVALHREATEAAAEARHASRAQASLIAITAELKSAKASLEEAAQRETDLARRAAIIEARERAANIELEARLAGERVAIRAAAEEEAERRHRANSEASVSEIRSELEAATRRLQELTARESEVVRQKSLLDTRAASLELAYEEKLGVERERVRQQAETDARTRSERLVSEERNQAAQKVRDAEARAEHLSKQAVEAIRQSRELEHKLQSSAVEAERRIAEETRATAERHQTALDERLRLAQEQHGLALAEYQQKHAQLERTAQELQRRLAQGSQQLQGEAQEVELRDQLGATFEDDSIEDVATGTLGADVIQRVRDRAGTEMGVIVWESKRTRQWSDAWPTKLRENLREVGGSIGVIVTQALPPGITHFGLRDGVWVCSWSAAKPMAAVLRNGILEVAATRRIAEGAASNEHVLFEYMTGPEFRNRLQGVIEAFTELQSDLQAERRAITRTWSRRDKLHDRALRNLGALYGDLQGIVGRKITTPDAFELTAGDEPVDDDELDTDSVSALARQILNALPGDGTAIGNGSLREVLARSLLLDLDAESGRQLYDAAVDSLVEAGHARRGKGRGGSLYRASAGVVDGGH